MGGGLSEERQEQTCLLVAQDTVIGEARAVLCKVAEGRPSNRTRKAWRRFLGRLEAQGSRCRPQTQLDMLGWFSQFEGRLDPVGSLAVAPIRLSLKRRGFMYPR